MEFKLILSLKRNLLINFTFHLWDVTSWNPGYILSNFNVKARVCFVSARARSWIWKYRIVLERNPTNVKAAMRSDFYHNTFKVNTYTLLTTLDNIWYWIEIAQGIV